MILCGKEFTTEEINQIQDIIAQNQDISRGKLSRLVCERLNWRSANGKLKEMRLRMVASLGGFLGRKCDGKPGTQALWLGLQRLDDITEMWKISMSVLAPHTLDPPIVSSNKCG